MVEQADGPSEEFKALLDVFHIRYEDIKFKMLYYRNEFHLKTSGIPAPYYHHSMSGIGLRETPAFINEEINRRHIKRIDETKKRIGLKELNHPPDAKNLKLIEWYFGQMSGAVRCAIDAHKRNDELIASETAAGTFGQNSEISSELDNSAATVSAYLQHAYVAAEWLFAIGRSLGTDISALESFVGECGGNSHLSDGIAESAVVAAGRVLAAARAEAAIHSSPSIELSFPAEHYRQKYGLAPNTLNKARRRGTLPSELRGRRWFYSLNDVRRLWPDVFTDEE